MRYLNPPSSTAPIRLCEARDGLSGQRDRHPFQDVDHAQQPVGRNAIDDVIGMADHDFAGESRGDTAHLFRVATHGVNIFENPQFVSALFPDVFEQCRLVEMIFGATARSARASSGAVLLT